MCPSPWYHAPSGEFSFTFWLCWALMSPLQKALFTRIQNIFHISAVGARCLAHRRFDFALHLPVNLSGGIWVPSNAANSAIVITLIHFLHWFACWSWLFFTPGSSISFSIIDTSPSLLSVGCHASSNTILPPRSSSRYLRCEISPGSRYVTSAAVSSSIGFTSPDSKFQLSLWQ